MGIVEALSLGARVWCLGIGFKGRVERRRLESLQNPKLKDSAFRSLGLWDSGLGFRV